MLNFLKRNALEIAVGEFVVLILVLFFMNACYRSYHQCKSVVESLDTINKSIPAEYWDKQMELLDNINKMYQK